MNFYKLNRTVWVAICLLIVACSPSPEEIATSTPTPVPPTSTPEPTPTATPVPYDLSMDVLDESGAPIGGATVQFAEMDQALTADDNGQVTYLDIPGNAFAYTVSAQGYNLAEGDVELERGSNSFEVTMARDPLQILPSEACQPGQDVLYIEDFEDGQGQLLEGLGRPLWGFEEDPVLGSYLVGNESTGWKRVQHNGENYGDFVLHFDMLRPVDVDIIWVRIQEGEGNSYIAVFSRDGNTWLQREGPSEPVWPARFLASPDGVTWEHVSLSTYEGAFDFWIENELILGVDDPEPLGPGAISIELTEHTQPFYVDNIVICGLTDPYEPPPSVEASGDS